MSAVTTHVLDTSGGTPAAGVGVVLELADGSGEVSAAAETDADGRVAELGPEHLDAGTYRLRFSTGAYFGGRGVTTFYPEVVVTFEVVDPAQHYHVPLLLSPFGYSTYRGS